MVLFLLLLIIPNFSNGKKGDTADLVYQMDIMFQRLNSDATINTANQITTNMLEILENVNSDDLKNSTSNIITSLDDILQRINTNKTDSILDNIERLTGQSKLYVNVDESLFNTVLITFEILLIILIIISIALFGLCIVRFLYPIRDVVLPTNDSYSYNFLRNNNTDNNNINKRDSRVNLTNLYKEECDL